MTGGVEKICDFLANTAVRDRSRLPGSVNEMLQILNVNCWDH